MGYAQKYLRNFQGCIVSISPESSSTLGEVVMLMDSGKMALCIQSLLQRKAVFPRGYDRMEISVILELANIIIHAIIGTLANSLGFSYSLDLPLLISSQEEFTHIHFMKQGKTWKISLVLKASLKIPGSHVDTCFLLLVELESPFSFFRNLEKISTHVEY
jgi:chemotaxis protein CheY-P-specific phosphatase CheC